MRVADAADLLGCSRQRVHQLIDEGKLLAEYDDQGRIEVDPPSISRLQSQRRAKPPRGWITLPEVAELLSANPATVYRWADAGLLGEVREQMVAGRPTRSVLRSKAIKFTPPLRGRPRGDQG